MIRFGCPTCRAEYEVGAVAAGKKADCKRCGQRLQVPASPRAKTVLGELLPPLPPADPGPPHVPPASQEPDDGVPGKVVVDAARIAWVVGMTAFFSVILIWLVILVVAAASPPGTVSHPLDTIRFAWGGVVAILGVGLALMVSARKGMEQRCPMCLKWWARKRIGLREMDRRRGMKTVARADHGSATTELPSGRTAHTSGTTWRQEQVQVLRVKCEHSWRCRFCGEEWKTESVDERQDFDF